VDEAWDQEIQDRLINLRAFPYYIPFIIRGSTLWVLAVAHSARKPEYWINRKQEG